MIKKLAESILFFTVFIVLTLLATDVFYRIFPSKDLTKDGIDIVDKRIHQLWQKSMEEKESYFFPPHLAFVNTGIEDETRLKYIAEQTLFPKDQTWTTPDFLRNPSEDSNFTVSTNQFGFRDSPRQEQKPQSTFRILALGSYPTFGLGVNNGETYPAQLEAALGQNPPLANRKFEVWNCGRQGSTAIMGLALLKEYLLKFKPDMILFDYGHVDLFAVVDSKELIINGTDQRVFIDREFTRFTNLVEQAKIFSPLARKFSKYLNSRQIPKKIELWQRVNEEVIKLASSQNIPVIFISHLVEAIKPESYDAFLENKPSAYFVNTAVGWHDEPLDSNFVEKFWSKPNWTNELGISKEKVEREPAFVYRGDAFFPNKQGHFVIAKQLYSKISEIIKD